MAVLGDTGGCCWAASLRALLRGKDSGCGSSLWKCGGASSLSELLVTEQAGDLFDRLIEPLADILQQWAGQ